MNAPDEPLTNYLPAATFPAERSRLIAKAVEVQAPEQILDELRALPGDHLFESVEEVAALRHASTRQTTDRRPSA